MAQALHNLGFVERELGDLNAARRRHQAALDAFEAMGDQAGMARVLTDLGVVHKDQGRLTEARASFERALTLLVDQGTPRARAHALLGLGLTLEMLHDVEGARRRYLEALPAYRQANDQENEALTLHNLGQLHDNQEEFEAALDYYRQSLEINQAIGAKLGVVEDLGALAAIYQVTGRPDQARELHEGALYLYVEMSHRRGQVWTLVDLGILARDMGDFDAAERYLTDALGLAQEMGDPHEIYEVHLNRGDMHLIAGRAREAAQDYAAAVEAVESIRASLLLEEEALNYFDAPHLEAYDRLVRLCAGPLNDGRHALVWAERAQAREFLRRLRLSEIVQSLRSPEGLVDRETELLIQLRRSIAALSAAGEPDRLATVRAYAAAEKALRAVWIEIESFDPEYVALRQGEPASWEALRGCLPQM